VVVVDLRNTAEIDLLQFAGAVRAQPKEQSTAIDDKPRTVGSPVRCLEEQSRRLVDEPPLTGVDGDDEELGALARAKSAWHGVSVLIAELAVDACARLLAQERAVVALTAYLNPSHTSHPYSNETRQQAIPEAALSTPA
jgi:hypothetical protein